MTKTKKNLTWKLTDLPTAGELADLVDSEVISKEEAREIMFGSPESDKEKVEALEKLVEFLQDLVKELSKNRNTTTFMPYVKTIEYTPRPYWDKIWCSTSKVLNESGLSVNTMSTSGTEKLKGMVTGGSIGTSGATYYDANSMQLSNAHAIPSTMTMTVSANDNGSIVS